MVYLDEAGSSQTWDASNYEIERSQFRSLLVKPDSLTLWPIHSSTHRRPITITFVAALVIGLTQVWTSFFFGSSVASAVIYAVFIAVLVFRPQGLLGRAGRV